MKHNIIETVMGFVVLLIAGFFLVFAYTGSQYKSDGGYDLTARFSRIDGVQTGSDIRLSGVKVGIVSDISIDPHTYLAIVKLNVSPDVKLPKDTSAEIVTDGLLGSKYIALVPGGDEQYLANNDEITYTQAAISLEAMIGQMIFSSKDKDEKDKKDKKE